MPAPQTPLVLVDNKFDRINQYPAATLSSSGEAPGTSVRHVADYRRERTLWQAATSATNRYVRSYLGVGNARAIDVCWLDRGHNLWGLDVAVESSDDNFATTPNTITRTVPAEGTIGGDPATTWCVTEEGALYTLFTAFVARLYHQLRVVPAAQPIITGLIVGSRTQLAGYSGKLDEDAGRRIVRTADSDAGYRASDRAYAYRTLQLELDLIGATEYDAKIRSLRQLLFAQNQPAVVVMDYGTKPERGWLYQYDSDQWSSPTSRVHRKCTIPLRELGAAIR